MILKRLHFKTLILFLSFSALLSSCSQPEAKENLNPSTPSSDQQISLSSGFYEAYTPERFNELYGSEKLALFFHADWCPTCRKLDQTIQENLKALNGRTILKVNYDTEKELKKQYGVTAQSTVAFLNADGSLFEKRLNPDLELIQKFFY